jgi:hypothetical protein
LGRRCGGEGDDGGRQSYVLTGRGLVQRGMAQPRIGAAFGVKRDRGEKEKIAQHDKSASMSRR